MRMIICTVSCSGIPSHEDISVSPVGLRACALFPTFLFPPLSFSPFFPDCGAAAIPASVITFPDFVWKIPKFRLVGVFQNFFFGLLGFWVVRRPRRGGLRAKPQIFGLCMFFLILEGGIWVTLWAPPLFMFLWDSLVFCVLGQKLFFFVLCDLIVSVGYVKYTFICFII
jgi:hypothetical protein